MRKVDAPLQVINQLMSENDKILFNLFYLIAESKTAFWVTDDKSYIIGQASDKLPMWIWIKKTADDSAMAELESVISEKLMLNHELKITADAERIGDTLQKISGKCQVSYKCQVPMVVYRCDKINNPKKAKGHCIFSNKEHGDILARFITGMVYDLEKRSMRENEAENFADEVAGAEDMYLWEDEGTVVSMAMITHRTAAYGRINTVYTDSNRRGKGYAGMLVSEVTQKILDEDRIPMLYTEKDNVCSNAMYQRIGYHVCGELVTYSFE